MMFDFSTITEVRLGRGQHSSPEQGLCFMEMAAWFAGEKHSDEPACACPVLGAYGICLNDSMSGVERDRLLKPLVPLIVGTRDPASERKRAEFLAMWAVNKIVPIVLRKAGIDATACENAKTLGEATAAANAAAAAAYANAAANAAWAAAAYAAEAAAAAAYANAAAAHAADAAAYATNANAAEVWSIAVEGLRQAILIGRHDGLSSLVPEPVIIERRNKLKELI